MIHSTINRIPGEPESEWHDDALDEDNQAEWHPRKGYHNRYAYCQEGVAWLELSEDVEGGAL